MKRGMEVEVLKLSELSVGDLIIFYVDIGKMPVNRVSKHLEAVKRSVSDAIPEHLKMLFIPVRYESNTYEGPITTKRKAVEIEVDKKENIDSYEDAMSVI